MRSSQQLRAQRGVTLGGGGREAGARQRLQDGFYELVCEWEREGVKRRKKLPGNKERRKQEKGKQAAQRGWVS